MAEKLSKEWFELQDIRKHNFSQADWIPVYAVESKEEGEYFEVGHESESFQLYAWLIKNEERKLYDEISGDIKTEWDRFIRNEIFRKRYDLNRVNGVYAPAYVIIENDKQVGNRLILVCDDSVLINQDFILIWNLKSSGNGYALPNREDAIHQNITNQGRITRIEIRADLLREYLLLRNSALRIVYFGQRIGVSAENKGYWELRRDNCYSFQESDHDYSFEERNTTCPTRGKGFYTEGELYIGAWLEQATKHKLILEPEGVHSADYKVWVWDDSPKKISLRESAFALPVAGLSCLWFEPQIISVFLDKYQGELEWLGRFSAKLKVQPDYNEVWFSVNEKGYINARAWDIEPLIKWQKELWLEFNAMPQERGAREKIPFLPQYPGDGKWLSIRRCGNEAPEVRLPTALEECEAIFEKIFSLKLFKQHESDEALAKSLHRFRSLDEDGLRGLAVDVYKFCMERLNIEALEQTFTQSGRSLTDEEKGKGRKLIEKLLELWGHLSRDAARNITAPLAGLYDLRNGGGVAHYPPSGKVEDCYKLLNIDRAQPHIEQAAQLLENVAIAFEQIAEVLSKGGNENAEAGGGQG